jgi:ribose transport system permease protein
MQDERTSVGDPDLAKTSTALLRLGLLPRLDLRLMILIAAMVGVAILFGSLNPYYLSWKQTLDIARQSTLLAVAALGAHLIIVVGEIDLSVGAVCGLVSVAVPGLLDLDLPIALVVLLALGIGAVVGAINGFVTLRLLVPSFLATLGTMSIARGVAYYISKQPRWISDETFGNLFNGEVGGLPLSVVYMVVLTALVAFIWKYSRFGLHVRAVGSSQKGARFTGIDTDRVKLAVFILAGVLSAAGGLLLLGRTLTGMAVAAEGLELNAIAAVLLGGGRLGGGKGSVVGTFLGALLLTMVLSGIAGMGLSIGWQDLTKGSILVVVILLMRK